MPQDKTCHLCGETKPLTDFIQDHSKKSGYRGPCKACKNRLAAERAQQRPHEPTATSETCIYCHLEKPAAEFPRTRRSTNGLHTVCRSCMNEYSREYRAKNKQQSPSIEPKTCTQCKQTKDATEFHPHKGHPGGLSYTCKECTRELDRRLHATHPERKIKSNRKWRQANPDTWNATGQKRRAWKKGAPGVFTPEDIHAILKSQHNRCVYCSSNIANDYTIDHIIPLSRPGTSNWPENIQLLCRSCNSSKNSKSHNEYLAWLVEQADERDSLPNLQLSLLY